MHAPVPRYTPPPGQRRIYVIANNHTSVDDFIRRSGVPRHLVTYLNRVERVRGLYRIEVIMYEVDFAKMNWIRAKELGAVIDELIKAGARFRHLSREDFDETEQDRV